MKARGQNERSLPIGEYAHVQTLADDMILITTGDS